jgi:hypothetical protein
MHVSNVLRKLALELVSSTIESDYFTPTPTIPITHPNLKHPPKPSSLNPSSTPDPYPSTHPSPHFLYPAPFQFIVQNVASKLQSSCRDRTDTPVGIARHEKLGGHEAPFVLHNNLGKTAGRNMLCDRRTASWVGE